MENPATLPHERAKKRPLSPPVLPADDCVDPSKPTSEDDDDGDWLICGSEEDEDHENRGIYLPYTVDDIPRPTSDHDQHSDILYRNPDVEHRGPLPIRVFPALRSAQNFVISMLSRALVEIELHALSEDEKGGDENLIIEGCTELDHLDRPKSFIEWRRLYSDNCELDIKYAVLLNAVEARVNIEVLRVPSHGVDLKIYAKTSGFSDKIRLFEGAVLEVGFTRSFAVAMVMNRSLDLYIKGSPRDDHALGQKPLQLQGSWRRNFSSDFHGTVERLVELGDLAKISVKVTWKSYRRRP